MPNPPEEWWLDDALAKEMGWDIDAIEAERRPQKYRKALRRERFSQPLPKNSHLFTVNT